MVGKMRKIEEREKKGGKHRKNSPTIFSMEERDNEEDVSEKEESSEKARKKEVVGKRTKEGK